MFYIDGIDFQRKSLGHFYACLTELLGFKRLKDEGKVVGLAGHGNFWIELYEYDRIVTFHLDTAILREGIEEYLEWDWIGAPCYNWVGDKTIQNGALSIRNPRIMEYVCRVHGWETDLQDLIQAGQYSTASFFAEDIFFCVRMIKYRIGNYPPIEIAKKFSVESKFELGTLGYHKISTYMSPDECKKIIQQYNKK